MVDRASEIVLVTVDLHKDPIHLPAPLGNLARRPGSAFLDLTGEEQPKPVDPFPHALMANVDAAFVQQVLGISERQRKADIHHDLQADDFRRRFEVAEGRFAHPKTMA